MKMNRLPDSLLIPIIGLALCLADFVVLFLIAGALGLSPVGVTVIAVVTGALIGAGVVALRRDVAWVKKLMAFGDRQVTQIVFMLSAIFLIAALIELGHPVIAALYGVVCAAMKVYDFVDSRRTGRELS